LVRSIASDVKKPCGADGGLETALVGSMAVTRQKSVAWIGRSTGGMKPVSLTPSVLVALRRTEPKAGVKDISNR
jgi:hypothetical protein